MTPEAPVCFACLADWLAWLERHHTSSSGVWLRFAKKGSALQSVTYTEALEAALCFGWIDAQKKPESDAAWLQRFTRRLPRSIWSKRNRETALALIAAGRMQPAGLAAVESAQADGRWDSAYDSPATAAVPDDFAAALARNRRAQAFFAALDKANRYAVLFRLQTARRPETRARRIRQFVDMLSRGEKLH
ncbi:MAG TPA: YdeI/OmpD-associated family protein [Bryobacteraceae bacterium]|nr:YdeI/OmpD-associated family protein [Bryobacteraceae bacterium]